MSPSGAKIWRQKIRLYGKERVVTHGRYPELGLLDARRCALKVKERLRFGADPVQEKREAKLLRDIQNASTFEEIGRRWYAHMSPKWCTKHAKVVLSRLENDAFKELGTYPISKVGPHHLLALVAKIEERGAHDIARRALQMCSQIFTFAMGHKLISVNPTYGLHRMLKPTVKGHFAALEPKDIPKLLEAIRAANGLQPTTRNAMLFMMLTGMRTIEIRRAKWEQFDFDNAEWNIPASSMKMRRAFKCPLSKQALAILSVQRKLSSGSDYVFPSVKSLHMAISEATVLNALKRMGFAGLMTGHGFRALFMTTAVERLKYPPNVPDKQLAHLGERLERAYLRSDLIEERAKLMQDWADYLDGNGLSSILVDVYAAQAPA